jgi:tRNA(His) 5'-end guanylyltransferase
MPIFDELGNRMKAHEKAFDFTLPPGQHVILRLDGNSFHKLTRGHFIAPFDERFKEAMYQAAIAVLDYCHGKIAYVQSDEISILIDDPGEGNEMLKNRVQKICSLVASACAVRFSKAASASTGKDIEARFDCRCFAIPRDEIINYFVYRQRDAIKNAISSIYYWKLRETMGTRAATAKAEGLPNTSKEFFLRDEHGITIDQYPVHYIRGALIYKQSNEFRVEDKLDAEKVEKYKQHGKTYVRKVWFVNKEIPVFSGSGYLQSLIGIWPPVDALDRD